MRFDPERHHRRSVRLKGYDYTQAGAYFVTICTYQRKCLYGKVVDATMRSNECGRIVEEEWVRTSVVRTNVLLDAFVVMPNHMHGILVIVNRRDTLSACPYVGQFGRPIRGSLPTIIGQFKSIVTKRINKRRGTPGSPVWQNNYHEHIIRNDDELRRIREYIVSNPARWAEDESNPDVRASQ